MKRYIENININLGSDKKDFEVAEALRLLANDIEDGKYSGIVGWSDVSWSIDLSEEEYDEESEE